MPTGTDPIVDEEIMGSSRWKKLAAGFGEVGAFLILVAQASSPGLAQLIEQIDGVVLVKDAELLSAPSALMLARVPAPTPTMKIALFRIGAGAADWPKRKWLYPALAGSRRAAHCWRGHWRLMFCGNARSHARRPA